MQQITKYRSIMEHGISDAQLKTASRDELAQRYAAAQENLKEEREKLTQAQLKIHELQDEILQVLENPQRFRILIIY